MNGGARPGAGRKPNAVPSVRLTAHVTPEVAQQLADFSAQHQCASNGAAIALMLDAMKHNETASTDATHVKCVYCRGVMELTHACVSPKT